LARLEAGTEIAAPHDLDVTRAALDAIGMAILIVDRSANLLHANRHGRRALQRNDGLAVRGDALCATSESPAQKLKIAIEAATGPAPVAGTVSLTTSGRQSWPITVVPLPGSAQSAALLIFRDCGGLDATLPSRLRSLFKLTAAEARLAIAVSEGMSVSRYASENLIARSTVRSQTKSIAAKMRCSRQVEIASIVAGLPPICVD
jgi:DNA-binding CsgD family transcriptional regulator